jgi:hypothetical protein
MSSALRSFVAVLAVAIALAIAPDTVFARQYISTVGYKNAGCSATAVNDWKVAYIYPLDSCIVTSAQAFNNALFLTRNSTH